MKPSIAITHQSLVLNLLPDQLVLAEGVTGFSCDGINRTFLHLLLDGAVEHEERLSGTFLHKETGSKADTEVKVQLLQGRWLQTGFAHDAFHQRHSPIDSVFSTCATQAQPPAAPGEDSQNHELRCSMGMLSLAW